jgi:hypothetical protein
MRVRGIFGRPFVDLEPHLDPGHLAELDGLHEEVCLGLAQIPVDYTGGSHRSMGIVPLSRQGECHVDYGEAIRAMTDAQFTTLLSLGDAGPEGTLDPARRRELETEMGEERAHPLSRRQMLWLKFQLGVYFPWKVYVELVPNRLWGDKSRAEGKAFTRQARAFFPKTVAWIERALPFEGIGRATIMGLEAHDHGTVHHDGDPREERDPDHFVTVCPMANKRLFLWDEEGRAKVPVVGRAYWFNDQDDHGVDADPFFRYSIRVDGVFRGDFLERLHEHARGGGS